MPLRDSRLVTPEAFPTELFINLIGDTGITSGIGAGFTPLPDSLRESIKEIDAEVDNFFRLSPQYGFESLPLVLTWGLRESRFSPVLFWEFFHILKVGGLWLDLDIESRCHGTSLCSTDNPERPFFERSMVLERRKVINGFSLKSWRKHSPSPLANELTGGWTFGILTSGPSPAGARMAHSILNLGRDDVEIIFCGPMPDGLPDDARIRGIDLERPEPRGWITRKKNLLAKSARYPNLCLLHDRFEIPRNFFEAMDTWGPCFSVLTFPEVYYADKEKLFPMRYPDYEILFQDKSLFESYERSIYNPQNVFHPEYSDYRETAFVCGGAYIAKRSIFGGIGQDESLFHGEWEDVTFGLACQRHGIPHRLNPYTELETLTPHPLGLTRMDMIDISETIARGKLIVNWGTEQITSDMTRFKPVLRLPRERYYAQIAAKWNTLSIVSSDMKLREEDWATFEKLSDFWEMIGLRLSAINYQTRDAIAEGVNFLTGTIFNWQNCQVQQWILQNEEILANRKLIPEREYKVGWGAGAMLRQFIDHARTDVAYVVDRNPELWGKTIEGIRIHPPSRLVQENPDRTLVVVFSAKHDEIVTDLKLLGNFSVINATARYPQKPWFFPVCFHIDYLREVERYYPVLFTNNETLEAP